MFRFHKRLDLQAKVSLVLVGVILPTFIVVTIAQNKLTQPILEDEIRQIGITSGKTLAAEIVSGRLLNAPNPAQAVDSALQDLLFSQPNIVRVDVIARDPLTNNLKVIASNIEDDPGTPLPMSKLEDTVTSEYRTDDSGLGNWEISVPIEHRTRDVRGPRRVIGAVHLLISTKLVARIVSTLWRSTATAASCSVVMLILVLSYFLRKTIENDRKLKQAESHNLELIEQLHEAERQLMNTEKLAVMGQLTASFAHEIGTPLNAISGHLQLLNEELPAQDTHLAERMGVIHGQVSKIEGIVKSFLQSTAKPTSQRQLVDVNRLVEKTIGIVTPRIESLNIEVKRALSRKMGPLRVVPLDLEQILLNLVNNSLDSLQAKAYAKSQAKEKCKLVMEFQTARTSSEGKQWAEFMVYDTGEGIKKEDLTNVLKPFFTTKRPGEGTGLGLTICRQIAHKYDGELLIDSKEGAWTQVTLRIPYHAEV